MTLKKIEFIKNDNLQKIINEVNKSEKLENIHFKTSKENKIKLKSYCLNNDLNMSVLLNRLLVDFLSK